MYLCNLLTVNRHLIHILNGAQLYVHYFPKTHWDFLNECLILDNSRTWHWSTVTRGSLNIEIFETKLHWSAWFILYSWQQLHMKTINNKGILQRWVSCSLFCPSLHTRLLPNLSARVWSNTFIPLTQSVSLLKLYIYERKLYCGLIIFCPRAWSTGLSGPQLFEECSTQYRRLNLKKNV